jgi:hypothetical protein
MVAARPVEVAFHAEDEIVDLIVEPGLTAADGSAVVA